MNFTPEFWLALAVPALGYVGGFWALRQQVKDMKDSMDEEKLERKRLDERVRTLEIAQGPQPLKSFAAKSGN